VENIPGQAEQHSGVGQKVFGFSPESCSTCPGMLFGFTPESCSTCPGMLFGLPRNTQKRIPVKTGEEYFIPRGILHGGEVLAGTRTIHAFGGHRANRVGA